MEIDPIIFRFAIFILSIFVGIIIGALSALVINYH